MSTAKAVRRSFLGTIPVIAIAVAILSAGAPNACAQDPQPSVTGSAAVFASPAVTASALTLSSPEQNAAATAPVNPWNDRPVCASMSLKADWQLTRKQRVCDWIHNGVFSTTAMIGAAWSAGYSQATDAASERGDPFATRFGRKFAQNAFKSTGAYVGGVIAREDPRRAPPFLALRAGDRRGGFWRRTGRAFADNVTSYRCVRECSSPSDIKRTPALSRILGSVASGFGGELLTTDRPDSRERALRGMASAFGATFVNALVVEFKPEISAFAGKAFRVVFGVR